MAGGKAAREIVGEKEAGLRLGHAVMGGVAGLIPQPFRSVINHGLRELGQALDIA